MILPEASAGSGEALRIAFFPDAYLEVDGVARVARQFEADSRQQNLPFLLVHAGPHHQVSTQGSVTRVQLRRSPATFPLDRAHRFDLLLTRHYRALTALLGQFQPDVILITGPSDMGILGMLLAGKLHLPLSATWQTNLPEYAGLRATQAVSWLPKPLQRAVASAARNGSAAATNRFYRVPRLLFAPNPEIVTQLAAATGRPCLRMQHGVDAEAFSPRFRDPGTRPFTIGYVGRLSAEKNIRDLARLERHLVLRGHTDFRIVIVGQGADAAWLRDNMQRAELRGALHGDDLSRAFANMDVLAFPSETDTFGLVVLEAMASGVPAVVTATGGPKYIVRHGETGYIAADFADFAAAIERLMLQPDVLARMRLAARQQAQDASWQNVFQEIRSALRQHFPQRASLIAQQPSQCGPAVPPWIPEMCPASYQEDRPSPLID